MNQEKMAGAAKDPMYEMYLEELKEVSPCTDQERKSLLARLAKGEKKAAERLIEGHLHVAMETAAAFANRGLPMGDLIQEANMALTLAVHDWEEGDFLQAIQEEMEEALALAIEEQGAQERTEEEITARVNVLKDVSQIMAEELGREATVAELAEKMKMTEDEIKSIMKITLDAMSVTGEE